MKISIGVLIVAATLVALSLSARQAPAGERKLRLGTYDNRAIAVAYAQSKYNPVAEKMKEHGRAKAAGDEKRVKELEQWGESHQRALHRQGFGRVPVDDLLAHVRERLPDVARQMQVDAITWQCDYKASGVEVVDVTDALAALFDPSEQTLKTLAELRNVPAIDLGELEKHQDH